MQEHEKGLLSLMIIGALIALGKALSSGEHITPSLFIGRIILGSAVSVAAAAILIWIPDINPLALSGAGAALGIAGYQVVEVWIRRKGNGVLSGKGSPK
ncbi:hypothetical protein ACVWV0_004048 [Ewingella americana]|uniref:holin n=1 Tax=Ewingella allii TaxID=3092550 RepID=UPI0037AF5F65